MPIRTRLFYLVAAWLPVGVVYAATGFVKGNPWIVPNSYVDNLIPFSPYGIWLYLAFYFYIPYTFISADEKKIRTLLFSFLVTTIISGVIFVLFPSSIVYPEYGTDGISTAVLNFVKEHDTAQNCFPSLHGSLITLCAVTNWERAKKLKSYLCVLITVLMYISIIQVRRHVFIDLAGGILLAVLVWVLVRRFAKSK